MDSILQSYTCTWQSALANSFNKAVASDFSFYCRKHWSLPMSLKFTAMQACVCKNMHTIIPLIVNPHPLALGGPLLYLSCLHDLVCASNTFKCHDASSDLIFSTFPVFVSSKNCRVSGVASQHRISFSVKPEQDLQNQHK